MYPFSVAGNAAYYVRRSRTLPPNVFCYLSGHVFYRRRCLRDADGYYRITGRVDDVLNVSGHRIGTAEVENAINMHSTVVESAVVGYRMI